MTARFLHLAKHHCWDEILDLLTPCLASSATGKASASSDVLEQLQACDTLSGNTIVHFAAKEDRVDVLEAILQALTGNGEEIADSSGSSSQNGVSKTIVASSNKTVDEGCSGGENQTTLLKEKPLGLRLLRARNYANRSPLQEAKAAGSRHVVEFLSSKLHTPVERLFYANDSFENMIKVFGPNAPPGSIDERLECYNGMTWAALCAEESRYPELRWLYENGADFSVLDDYGNSLLHLISIPPEKSEESDDGDSDDEAIVTEKLKELATEELSNNAAGDAVSEVMLAYETDAVDRQLCAFLGSLGPLDEFNDEEKRVLKCAAFLLSLKRPRVPPRRRSLEEQVHVSSDVDDLLSHESSKPGQVGICDSIGSGVFGDAEESSEDTPSAYWTTETGGPDFLLDLKLANHAGSTPAHCIAEQHSSNPCLAWRMLRLFKQRGADLNARDASGMNVAMTLAQVSGDGPWLAWCLAPDSGGCDPDATDAKGRRVEDHVVIATLETFDPELDIDEEYEEEEGESHGDDAISGGENELEFREEADEPFDRSRSHSEQLRVTLTKVPEKSE